MTWWSWGLGEGGKSGVVPFLRFYEGAGWKEVARVADLLEDLDDDLGLFGFLDVGFEYLVQRRGGLVSGTVVPMYTGLDRGVK